MLGKETPMKITKKHLERIIKEETAKVLEENTKSAKATITFAQQGLGKGPWGEDLLTIEGEIYQQLYHIIDALKQNNINVKLTPITQRGRKNTPETHNLPNLKADEE